MVDLIYIDPPFNSKRKYNIVFDSETGSSEEAFSDVWSRVAYLDLLPEINTINPQLHKFLIMLKETGLDESYLSYLSHMAIRCYYMRRMLKDTGSLYYHCDPTASHYIKIVLDYIFGMKNFRNEIVWHYGLGGSSNRLFSKKHDIIFYYTMSDSYHFDKPQVPATSQMLKGQLKGADTVWDIPTLNNMAKERLGYPTQKPEALIERIIKASSNEGDLVADFFLGGGTTASVCHKLNRNFLGSDLNYRAIQITKDRLIGLGATLKKDLLIHGIPASSKDLRRMVADNIIGSDRNSRFELEDITIKYYLQGVVGNTVKVGDDSVDGRFGFTYRGEAMRGIVQVTSGGSKNHLKAFCSEVGKGNADMGVYIMFADDVTDGFIREVKGYGKLGDVDKIQILTFEDLVDQKQQFQLPADSLAEFS